MKKIMIVGDVTGMCDGYHVGDDAMFEVALSRILKYVDKNNIIVISPSPKTTKNSYDVCSILLDSKTFIQRFKNLFIRPHHELYIFWNIISSVFKCKIIFVSGGGNHTSVWKDVFETRMYLYFIAFLFRKPIIFSSQTFGPFTDYHMQVCRRLLRRSKFLGVRDKNFSAKQIQLTTHFAVDDAVFLEKKHNQQTQQIINCSNKIIGLSMRHFKGATDNDRDNICKEVALYAIENNMKTVFIPHHAPNQQKDLSIAQTIKKYWKDKDQLYEILYPIPLASAVKALTGECSVVVAMRYHQVVFSLSVGVPVIGVYVEEYTKAKLKGAFEQFELEPLLLSIKDHDKVHVLLHKALNRRDDFFNAANFIFNNSILDNMKPYELCFNIYNKK